MANVIINACDLLWWQQWCFGDFLRWIKYNSETTLKCSPKVVWKRRELETAKPPSPDSTTGSCLQVAHSWISSRYSRSTISSVNAIITVIALLFFCKLVWHCFLNFSLTTDACIQYEYSGCGGNTNTFVTEDVSGWNFYLQPRQRWWWIIWRVQPLW